MGEVEIDPMVMYLMLILVLAAFCPPLICKLKQLLTSNKVAPTEDDLETGAG